MGGPKRTTVSGTVVLFVERPEDQKAMVVGACKDWTRLWRLIRWFFCMVRWSTLLKPLYLSRGLFKCEFYESGNYRMLHIDTMLFPFHLNFYSKIYILESALWYNIGRTCFNSLTHKIFFTKNSWSFYYSLSYLFFVNNTYKYINI